MRTIQFLKVITSITALATLLFNANLFAAILNIQIGYAGVGADTIEYGDFSEAVPVLIAGSEFEFAICLLAEYKSEDSLIKYLGQRTVITFELFERSSSSDTSSIQLSNESMSVTPVTLGTFRKLKSHAPYTWYFRARANDSLAGKAFCISARAESSDNYPIKSQSRCIACKAPASQSDFEVVHGAPMELASKFGSAEDVVAVADTMLSHGREGATSMFWASLAARQLLLWERAAFYDSIRATLPPIKIEY